MTATPRAPTMPLRCWTCGRRLRRRAGTLVCGQGHEYVARGGIYDLWPPGRPVPQSDAFAGPYGWLYDAAIKERPLARIVGGMMWGGEVATMFELMDDGVKCTPGQVILDVPAGGAPVLRSAPGRMLGTYIGLDLSGAMLIRAEAVRRSEDLDNVVLARADITRLPVPDRSVDRVLCFNGLHVIPDKAAALREFHRVLRPGGEVWGSVVVADSSARGLLTRPWGSRQWWFFHPGNARELATAAAAAGLDWKPTSSGSLMLFRATRPG